MRTNRLIAKSTALSALGFTILFSTSAFAQKDVPYPSGATAKISGDPAATKNNFTVGADGHTTLVETVYPGQIIIFDTTWSLQDRSPGNGQDTVYPAGGLTLSFAAMTTPPAPSLPVAAISNCVVKLPTDTCAEPISFTAPATPGSYELKIAVSGPGTTGNTGLSAGPVHYLNFTVSEPTVVLRDTQLTVAKQCVLLNAGDVDLSATLSELPSGEAVPGATIDFFVNPLLDGNGDPTVPSVGSAVTDFAGAATLSFNVNGLGVGDHNLYAEYAGNSQLNPSNDSDILGISYLFVGFQPPINPEGNSVFGNGRVIPIKIRLVDANNQPVPDATPTVWLTQYSSSTGLGEVLEAASSVSAADTDNIMRYVPEDGQYIYNWDLSQLSNGTYAVVVDVGDSAGCSKGPYYAVITVAKKGKK